MSPPACASGGRQGNGSHQYTIQADALDDLNKWVPKITEALQNVPELLDVNSDQQDKGLEVDLKIDRATASRLGLTASQIDNTLYDAFGQRQVSTIYKDKNQYHVVMEVAPEFWQSPETLRDIYVSTAGNINGTQASAGAGGAFSGATTAAATTDSNTGTDAAAQSAEAVRNQQLNAITSTGARRRLDRRLRFRPGWKRWCRYRLSSVTDPAPRRCRSIIRAPSSPPPSPSICRKA